MVNAFTRQMSVHCWDRLRWRHEAMQCIKRGAGLQGYLELKNTPPSLHHHRVLILQVLKVSLKKLLPTRSPCMHPHRACV